MQKPDRIRTLINRLARMDSTQGWAAGLNPAQMAALDYLGRANRFSRSPSHLADYLGATRGTVSQTLKSLQRKGLVAEERSTTDRRSISYAATEASPTESTPSAALLALGQQDQLAELLETLLTRSLTARGGRAFGICSTCRHFSAKDDGGYCTLLQQALLQVETTQICHEQVAA